VSRLFSTSPASARTSCDPLSTHLFSCLWPAQQTLQQTLCPSSNCFDSRPSKKRSQTVSKPKEARALCHINDLTSGEPSFCTSHTALVVCHLQFGGSLPNFCNDNHSTTPTQTLQPRLSLAASRHCSWRTAREHPDCSTALNLPMSACA
jgi:hypothetical protein